ALARLHPGPEEGGQAGAVEGGVAEADSVELRPLQVVVLDRLPTLAAGKPDRAALRALLSSPEPLER
ncbi:MAG: hypothetical protein M3R01_11795, partial [Actinomycetota bacterium]|nr:hypothetical protein [Actinomycetota bacterium]